MVLSDHDRNDIAERISQKLAEKMPAGGHHCIHEFTHEEAEGMRSFIQFWSSSKQTIGKTVVGFFVIVLLGALGLGVVELLRSKMGLK